MSLKSSTKVDTNRYQLEIAVSAEEFEKALAAVFAKQSKNITIPGFRKGKAPRKFIEKYYGDQVFYEDAVNAIYPDALEAAIAQAGLKFVEDKIDFDMDNLSKDGFTFKATITVAPEVEIEGYKGLEITKKAVNVTDDDVNAEVDRARDRASRMVTVEGRAAKDGDTAVLDYEGSVDGVPFDGGKAENYSLTLGSGQFIPGFEEQIVGHNSGDEFDVNVTFPEEYHAEELKGKAAVFKCKLHEIKEKELPALDDDFVKDISEFDTVDAYKDDVRKKLTENRQKAEDDNADNQLIDKTIELMKAEVPAAMIENKINDDIREFSYRLQSQGLDFDTYLKYTGATKESIRDSFRPQSERQVKLRLALEKIAQLENIAIDDETAEAEFKKMADTYKMDVERVKTMVPADGLKLDLAVEKAMSLIRDSAVIKTEE